MYHVLTLRYYVHNTYHLYHRMIAGTVEPHISKPNGTETGLDM